MVVAPASETEIAAGADRRETERLSAAAAQHDARKLS